MKKSIYLFISGSLFGVIAAVAIVKSTTNTEQNIAVIPPSIQGMKVITAKMQAENMPTESMSDLQVRLSQQPGSQGMMDSQSNEQAMMPSNDKTITSTAEATPKQPQQKMASAAPDIPPTEQQIKQYSDMEKTIALAANNPKIKLTELLRLSNTLTIQQRNQLTEKAMGMISRGELTVEQFASK